MPFYIVFLSRSCQQSPRASVAVRGRAEQSPSLARGLAEPLALGDPTTDIGPRESSPLFSRLLT